MRIKIGSEKIEVRTKIRTVVITELISHGEVIATGEAVLNPRETFDQEYGTRLSSVRAVGEFFDRAYKNFEALKEAVPKLEKSGLGGFVKESMLRDESKALMDIAKGLAKRKFRRPVTGRLSSSNPNLQNIPIRTGREARAAMLQSWY